jgi:hypothetical protein
VAGVFWDASDGGSLAGGVVDVSATGGGAGAGAGAGAVDAGGLGGGDVLPPHPARPTRQNADQATPSKSTVRIGKNRHLSARPKGVLPQGIRRMRQPMVW